METRIFPLTDFLDSNFPLKTNISNRKATDLKNSKFLSGNWKV